MNAKESNDTEGELKTAAEQARSERPEEWLNRDGGGGRGGSPPQIDLFDAVGVHSIGPR